ncbi:hypothetical protein RIF29_00876 [Crotalaria pallida]|uniref:Uncharacterized protein n=1 Tax=Crotalaria pallida TaxID=3830 RepID=A0AAN9IW70_CROPI
MEFSLAVLPLQPFTATNEVTTPATIATAPFASPSSTLNSNLFLRESAGNEQSHGFARCDQEEGAKKKEVCEFTPNDMAIGILVLSH